MLIWHLAAGPAGLAAPNRQGKGIYTRPIRHRPSFGEHRVVGLREGPRFGAIALLERGNLLRPQLAVLAAALSSHGLVVAVTRRAAERSRPHKSRVSVAF